jgi:hypothetical protein
MLGAVGASDLVGGQAQRSTRANQRRDPFSQLQRD